MSVYMREKLRIWVLSPWPGRNMDEHVLITDAITIALQDHLVSARDIMHTLRYSFGYDPLDSEAIARTLTVLATLTGYTNETFVYRYWADATLLENKTRVAQMDAVSLEERFTLHV